MAAYYNEYDPFAAAWLRELIRAGAIPAGDVDERSIANVRPDDLVGYRQLHFFAGIGGWAHALRLAGWPDDKPVWTGSCPCQPFSIAGKGDGVSDDRHLWPEFARLIGECRPATVFGEQVASPAGRGWLSAVRTDLEALGYAVGAADLCAAGVGAPHIRQRLYWVGHRLGAGLEGLAWDGYRRREPGRERPDEAGPTAAPGAVGEVADADGGKRTRVTNGQRCITDGEEAGRFESDGEFATSRGAGCVEQSDGGFWAGSDWLPCRDEKWRPVEPGTFPLAHGVPARVGRLRGYGNAIVPQVAAAFVRAVVL